MQQKQVTIDWVYSRQGDRNKMVTVYGIMTTSGERFEAVRHLDNAYPNFPTPSIDIQKLKPNMQGTVHFGNKNGYQYPTFIGFT